MFLSFVERITMKHLLKSPLIFLSSLELLFESNVEEANRLFLSVAKHHQKVLKSKKIQQTDKLVNFLCDLHLQNEVELNSGVYSEYSWMYSTQKGKIRLSRPWIWAIQAELGLELIPNELLLFNNINHPYMRFSELIHFIHLATYNILAYKNLKPSFSLIYRNVIKDDRELTLIGSLSKTPVIEFYQINLDDYLNTRCCSIKPHGCENYDFSISQNDLFVVARGMNEAGYGQFQNVMPTIVFSMQHMDLQRFKSTASYKDVLFLGKTQIESFIYLYE
jgi:hypothetical protein